MRPILSGLLVALALSSACRDTNIVYPPTAPTTPVATTPATPTTPTKPTPASSTTTFQFRVNGNATAAKILYSSPQDGLLQTISALPFSATVSSAVSTVFLSLDATPVTFPSNVVYPFMTVQILVNGDVFREATLSTFGDYPVSVSGTYRAPAAPVQ